MVNSEVKIMLRKVTFYDFIIGYFCSSIIYFIYKQYAWIFLIGLAIAVINFILSGIITEKVLLKNKAPGIFFMLIKLLRIFLICIVPFVFYRYSTYCVITYLLGFTSHFMALVLYSLFNKSSN